MAYDYYLQHPKSPSLRRYPKGVEAGERWDDETGEWTNKCAPRVACVMTKDTLITEQEAATFTGQSHIA